MKFDWIPTLALIVVLLHAFLGLERLFPHCCPPSAPPAVAFREARYVAEFEILDGNPRFPGPTWTARPLRTWKGRPARVVTIHGPRGSHRPPVRGGYRFVLASNDHNDFWLRLCSPFVRDPDTVEKALGPGQPYVVEPGGPSWLGSRGGARRGTSR